MSVLTSILFYVFVYASLTFPLLFFLWSLVILKLFFGLFPPENIFIFFPINSSFQLKQRPSLNFFVHVKTKAAPSSWDEIIKDPLFSLAAKPFQSFGPRNHRLRICQALILQVGKIEAQRGKRLSLEKPQLLNGRIREPEHRASGLPLPLARTTLRQHLTHHPPSPQTDEKIY